MGFLKTKFHDLLSRLRGLNPKNNDLLIAVQSGDLESMERLCRENENVSFRAFQKYPLLHLAIIEGNYHIATYLLKLGADPHAVTTDPFYEDYTALHLACLRGSEKLVKSLIKTYRVNPSAVASNIQPIHLAIFQENLYIVYLLLEASIDVETKIDQVIWENGSQRDTWRGNIFSDRISLLTFAVIYGKTILVKSLIDYGADFRVKNSGNRSLLMCAVYYQFVEVVKLLVAKLSVEELNCRDNDGFSAMHYLFKKEIDGCPRPIYQNKRYEANQRFEILEALAKAGADTNLLIDGNPGSLVINMAAYRHEHFMLAYLLPIQKYSLIARPLFYANLPDCPDYSKQGLRQDRDDKKYSAPFDKWSGAMTIVYKSNEDLSSYLIAENIMRRKQIGLPVLPEEVDLVDELDLTESGRFKNLYSEREKIFQEGLNSLREKFITFDTEKISAYEILKKSDKELRRLVKNKKFLRAFKKYKFFCIRSLRDLHMMIRTRIEEAVAVVELGEEKNIDFPADTWFYYIPYDCTLTIIEYMRNCDLKNFILAWTDV